MLLKKSIINLLCTVKQKYSQKCIYSSILLSITFLFSLWRAIDVFSVLGKFVPERLAYLPFSDLRMVCGCYGKL
jgi:hypothetical protein